MMKKNYYLLIALLMSMISFQAVADEGFYDHLRVNLTEQALSAEKGIKNDIISQLQQRRDFIITGPIASDLTEVTLTQNDLVVEVSTVIDHLTSEKNLDKDTFTDDEDVGYSISSYRWIIGLSLLLRN